MSLLDVCQFSVFTTVILLVSNRKRCNMNYKGTIIEESLKNKEVLKDLDIVNTKVEAITERHRTPLA